MTDATGKQRCCVTAASHVLPHRSVEVQVGGCSDADVSSVGGEGKGQGMAEGGSGLALEPSGQGACDERPGLPGESKVNRTSTIHMNMGRGGCDWLRREAKGTRAVRGLQ